MLRIEEVEGSPEAVIVEWINTFDSISHPVTQLQDLSDGIILFEVVSDIDQKWFKLIRSADVGDNWVLKINNLKKLYKLISRYYEEKLDQWTFSDLPEVNLTAIAKDSNPREILQLCKYILIIAVFCDNRSEYINRIMKLDKVKQEHIMHLIDDVMRYKTLDGAQEEDQHDGYAATTAAGGALTASSSAIAASETDYPHNHHLQDIHTNYDPYYTQPQPLSDDQNHTITSIHVLSPTASTGPISAALGPPGTPLTSSFAMDDSGSHYNNSNAYRSELVRITKEKEQLEVHNKQLIDDHSELLAKYDRLEAERQDLQARLRDMDNAVARANETGKADFIMRTEIDHLKQDLQRSEDTRQEQERRLEDQASQIKDLTRKTEELTKHADLAVKYKDQLDEYRHTNEKLQKAENVIEKYKKKLEDTADLRRQVKHLEETNHNLMDHNSKLEEEYRSILAFKTLMDSYKNQVAELETKNNELVREKNKLDYELAQCTKKLDSLEADKARDTDRIQALEEELQEAQLRMVGVDSSASQRKTNGDDADDMDIDDLNDSLEENLKESNVAELKMSKRRLERQVKTLQEEKAANAGGSGQKVLVLQHLLDDANRLKNKFEKDYIEVSKERDILQSDMAHIRADIPDAMLDENRNLLALRLRIRDLEKEIKSLTENMEKLKKRVADGRFFGDDGDDGQDGMRNKFDEIEMKSKMLEEQTRQQMHDINKLLLEKDILQGQSIEQKDLLLEKERLNSEMKATLAAIEAKEDEPFFRQQNAMLQQQLVQLREEQAKLKSKLKKAQDFISQQDKLMKEGERNRSSSNHYAEAVESLKAEIQIREEECSKLKSLLHETRSQARREQQLMTSAWYDLSRQVNNHAFNHSKSNTLNLNKRQPTSWLGQQRRALDNQIKRR